MKLTFQPITGLANRAIVFAANQALRTAAAVEEETLISDYTGFHIYGDLHLTLELSAATEQDKANLFARGFGQSPPSYRSSLALTSTS